ELVERLLQRLAALLLFDGELLPLRRRGLDLLLQIAAQGGDVLAHLLAFLRGGHAGGGEGEAGDGGKAHGAHLSAHARSVKKSELLAAAQALELVLPAEGGGAGARRFRVHQRERPPPARVTGAAALLVRGEAPGKIVGDAGVEGAVAAAEEVDAPHRARRIAGGAELRKLLLGDRSSMSVLRSHGRKAFA